MLGLAIAHRGSKEPRIAAGLASGTLPPRLAPVARRALSGSSTWSANGVGRPTRNVVEGAEDADLQVAVVSRNRGAHRPSGPPPAEWRSRCRPRALAGRVQRGATCCPRPPARVE